ncbi:excinuclease ABC subunit A [Pasteurellaceae bacterium LIM206]|nr:excinuclease ABC subunit A [Pasteurellaceae bacterium LIM206]
MKKTLFISLVTITLAACSARNTTHYYSIESVLNSAEAKTIVDPNIQLYFAQPAPGKVIIADAVTNKKTNFANKSDQKGCNWAFLSAVKQLQERAKSEGATKVGNIVSYYKKKTYASPTNFECHAGHIIGGVALKGDIVK